MTATETKPSVPAKEHLRIATAIDEYLTFVKHNRSPRTYLTYRYTLDVLLR